MEAERSSGSRLVLGADYYRHPAKEETGGGRREAPEGPGTPEEIQASVDSWGPIAVSLIGVIGLGLTVWLMVIKPV